VARELRKYRGVTEEQLATNISLCWTAERGLLAGLVLVFQTAEHILARASGLLAKLCNGYRGKLKSIALDTLCKKGIPVHF